MTVSNNYEPWVWTELLAFDNAQKDGGAAEYIKELGFVPKGICLMTSSPDFGRTAWQRAQATPGMDGSATAGPNLRPQGSGQQGVLLHVHRIQGKPLYKGMAFRP